MEEKPCLTEEIDLTNYFYLIILTLIFERTILFNNKIINHL